LNWEEVCPKKEGDEIYILGNPPYLGSSMQDKQQKADLEHVCKGFENYKNLDYIACWFVKGASYISKFNSKFSFVSTNSICQGEQVALLWPFIFKNNLEIIFAYPSFKWANNAKSNAAVIVSIIGVANVSASTKRIYRSGILKITNNINPYLTTGKNIVLPRRAKPISPLPFMVYGNKPTDGGHLILDRTEKDSLLSNYPDSIKYIKKFASGSDYLNSVERWCLWITDENYDEAKNIPEIDKRLKAVEDFRLRSDALSTVEYAIHPHRFRQITFKESSSIIIPLTSSERREYIPFGFLSGDTVVSNSASVIYCEEIWILVSYLQGCIWLG